jgi:hypothetical protein
LPLHARRQIRQLLGVVFKWVKLGIFFDLEIRGVFWRMVKTNDTFDIDVRARCVEIKKRDAVAEDVMDPPKATRLRRNCQV